MTVAKAGVDRMRISERQLDIFFSRVSPEEEKKHVALRRNAAENAMIEEGERAEALASLGGALGLESPGREVLTDREKAALRSAIRSYREGDEAVSYEEMCQGFMRSLRTRALFKARFKAWEAGFKEKNPEIAAMAGYRESEEFKKYVEERGEEFIRENMRLIVEDTVTSFVENNAPEEKEEPNPRKAQEVSAAVNDFIDNNYNEILSEDEKIKNETYEKFKLMMSGSGYGEVDEAKIRALYEKIVITTVFHYLSVEEYRVLSGTMIANVDKEMSDEEWEALLYEATENRYQELEDAVKENPAVKTSGIGGGIQIVTADGSYGSIEAFGSARGVVFRPVEGEEGVYEVDSDKIKNKQYLPRVRINDGFFEMEMLFPDANSQYDGDSINSHPSKKYKYGSLQEAINRQLLDYQLNVESRLKQTQSMDVNPNRIINDNQMVRLAVSLFGFNLNERQLGRGHLQKFENLCRILMKDNGKAMTERVEMALNFMRNRNNAGVISNILAGEGSRIHNIDGLIRYAQEIRMGKENIGTGVRI